MDLAGFLTVALCIGACFKPVRQVYYGFTMLIFGGISMVLGACLLWAT